MKHLVRSLVAGFCWLGLVGTAFSQSSGVGIGEWRVYVPNKSARSVAAAGNRIYCATEKGFFYFDKEFNNLQTLSKVNGLHDIGISTINYDSLTSTLLVAYENTNLDLIRGEEIINVNDILRKTLAGQKTINHIHFKDKLAYLSTSFGLVVLDLVKLEIKDTYTFQNAAGSSTRVFSATTLNDQIFIATSSGIMSARLSRTINLNDLKNWTMLSAGLPAGAPAANMRSLATFKGNVFAAVDYEGVYKLNGTTWNQTSAGGQGVRFRHLAPGRSALLVTNERNLRLLDAAGNVTEKDDDLLEYPSAAAQDKDRIYWVADQAKGLVRIEGQKFENLVPNAPFSGNVFRLMADGTSVIAVSGGYVGNSGTGTEDGFFEFKNGFWENYNYRRFNDPSKYPVMRDLTDVVRNPVNGKLYFASYGFGVMEWSGPGEYKIWNNTNSTLNSTLGTSTEYVRVASLAADQDGSIWATNISDFASLSGLHVLRPDNQWQEFDLKQTSDGITFPTSNFFEKIIIDDNGYKWISVRPRNGNGLVVFDDVNNRLRYLTNAPASGNLPGSDVHSLVKDNKGEIWVGTENGIGIFYDPGMAFAGNKSISADVPVIGNRGLLEGQIVKVIAVDGANRKWVGTENGVWLFNEDGDKVILNFTTANSPLPSDKITDIKVNNATGDVFIGTEGGLVSYRAGATVTVGKTNCANVFPNPVRPGYTGQIGISGLANNGIVKITDITGALVYETKALGGTAVWHGRDINGKKVRSGVYLVLSSNAEGAETCISKVAVIE